MNLESINIDKYFLNFWIYLFLHNNTNNNNNNYTFVIGKVNQRIILALISL